ncbi:MAG: hypothetical protein IJZ83_01085 [Clostridia bacterium]|nr:hypothetical protein [Clostridia bacterium]
MVLFSKSAKKERDAYDGVISQLHEEGRLLDVIEEYVARCHSVAEGEAKARRRSEFPNIAGFCRYVGVGFSDFYKFKEEKPREYDKLLAIFEDEALNSDISSTLLSSYMKKRMLYSDADEGKGKSGGVTYCFEHDVFADGE